MKFTTTVEQLRDTLALASVITPNQHQLTAYTAVHLATTAGTLTVRGRDDDTTVTVKLSVPRPELGSVLVPPGPVLKYLNTFPGDLEVTAHSASGTSLRVQVQDNAPYKFTALAEAFPAASAPRREKVPANLSLLAHAVEAVAPCADTLPGAQGSDKVAQLVSTPEGVFLNATDALRAGSAQLPKSASFGTFDGLLSLRVLNLVASINPTHVQLDPHGRTIVFHSENATVDTKLAQATFPSVSGILARTLPHSARIPRQPTLEALRRLGSVAGAAGELRVKVLSDELTLSVSNKAQGDGQEVVTLPQAADGELEMVLNVDFFTQTVRTHDEEVITMSWMSPIQPLLVTSAASVPVTHAIAAKQTK